MKRITPEQLDTVYSRWSVRHLGISYDRSYQRVSRFRGTSPKFEGWLYDQGGVIKQENHRRFAEFADEEQWMQFVLTWT